MMKKKKIKLHQAWDNQKGESNSEDQSKYINNKGKDYIRVMKFEIKCNTLMIKVLQTR